MKTQFSIPVIHPAFELLKRSSRILHFIAGSIILVNALYQLLEHSGNHILCYTQLVIVADIYILVFFGGDLLTTAPKLNLIFRLVEGIVLMGVSFILLKEGFGWLGIVYLALAVGYFFLFYRERRVLHSEAVDIKPTGITIPNFLKDGEISWNEVKSIIPKYHSIFIETFRHKKIQFPLRRNLKIEELQQIDDFCRQHLLG